MTSILVSPPDDVLQRAERHAGARGKTVAALVSDDLQRLGVEERDDAATRERFAALMDASPADLGEGHCWNREALYADRLLPRHQRPDLRGGRSDEGA